MRYHVINRKTELLRAGVTQQSVADTLGVSLGLVCKVVAGQRTTGPMARRVMAEIARRTRRSVDDLWPERPVVGRAA